MTGTEVINTPPEILEAIAESPAGRVHRARMADGREVAAIHVVLPDAAAVEAASDRLRRLSKISDPNLSPVLGWWIDGTSVWYLTELDEGLPFSRFPATTLLSPQQSVALSLGILQGLTALYDEGLSHGALGAANVRVDGRGRIRLAGHPLAMLRFPSDSELVAEIRVAGRLVCDAFAIPVEKTGGPPRAIEHAAPALVVAARSIANGTVGKDVKGAAASLRDTAGPLANRERLALGSEELGALVSGREPDRSVPPLRGSGFGEPPPPSLPPTTTAGPVPPRPAPPGPAPVEPNAAAAITAPVTRQAPSVVDAPLRSPRVPVPSPDHFDDEAPPWQRIAVIAVIFLVAAVIVGGVIVGTRSLLSSPAPTASSKPPPRQSPAGTPRPSPSGPAAVPVYAPAAAGAVKAVSAVLDGPCAIGSGCTVQVTVNFDLQPDPHAVTWAFKIFDRCAGTTSDQPGGVVTAQGGWNTIIGDTVFTLPAARGQIAVVAVSTAPDRAASQPLLVGGSTGC